MQPTQIHKGKTPHRRHYIAEWMAKTGKEPKDLIEATGADKSLVSRWLAGVLPREPYLLQLAALFDTERDSLFRDPDDDWIARFLRDRSADERARVKQMLEAAFPPKTGTAG